MKIAFDWDGTIAKKDVANEAGMRRFKWLGMNYTKEQLDAYQKTHKHYPLMKKNLSEYTGITDKRILTEMMTSLFRIHYVAVCNEWQEKVFFPGMKELLLTLKEQGHELYIFSTLRQDLIEESLRVLNLPDLFTSIKAEPGDLRYSKEELIKMLPKPDYAIGDRVDDMQAGRSVNAKTILTSWGHHLEEAKELADHVVTSAEDILNILEGKR